MVEWVVQGERGDHGGGGSPVVGGAAEIRRAGGWCYEGEIRLWFTTAVCMGGQVVRWLWVLRQWWCSVLEERWRTEDGRLIVGSWVPARSSPETMVVAVGGLFVGKEK